MDVHTGEVARAGLAADVQPQCAGPGRRTTRRSTGRRSASTSSARPSSRSPSRWRWNAGIDQVDGADAMTRPRRSRSAASRSTTTIRPAPLARRARDADLFVQHRHGADRRRSSASSGRSAMFRRAGLRSSRSTIELHGARPPALPPGATGAQSTTMTVGFGHGIAVTPLHLAIGYAAAGQRRHLSSGDDAEGRAGTGRAGQARVLGRHQRTHAPAAPAGRDSTAPARKAERPGLPRRRQDRHRREGQQAAATTRTSTSRPSPACSRWTTRAMWSSPCSTSRTATPRPSASRPRAGTPRRVVAKIVARIAPMLGVVPDSSTDIDVSEMLGLVVEGAGQGVRLGDLVPSRGTALGAPTEATTRTRHRLRDRPSQGRAGHRLRRVPRARVSTARTSSPQAVAAGAVAVVARPEAHGRRAPPMSPPPSRAAPSRELAAQFFAPFPETVSRSPAPTARPRRSS